MTNQEISIMAAVCHKSAVELLKDKDYEFDDMIGRVDILARALFINHLTWIKELQNENQSKTN